MKLQGFSISQDMHVSVVVHMGTNLPWVVRSLKTRTPPVLSARTIFVVDAMFRLPQPPLPTASCSMGSPPAPKARFRGCIWSQNSAE